MARSPARRAPPIMSPADRPPTPAASAATTLRSGPPPTPSASGGTFSNNTAIGVNANASGDGSTNTATGVIANASGSNGAPTLQPASSPMPAGAISATTRQPDT